MYYKNINNKNTNERMQKSMNNKSGITLVALIITIIVLLILATVSISLVINNNVLDKAQHGVDKYSEEEIKEKIGTAFSEYQMTKYHNLISFRQALADSGIYVEESAIIGSDSEGYTVTYNEKEYQVSKTGEVESIINDKELEIHFKIISVEKTKMNLELELPYREKIEKIAIMDTYNNDLVEYNKETIINNSKIKSDMHLEKENYIYIKTNNEIHFYKVNAGYTQITNENGTANNLKNGFYAYGAKGQYYYKELSGNYTFSNESFDGDPISGIAKAGYFIEDVEIKESKKFNKTSDFLFESANIVLKVKKIENNKFYIELDGCFLEMVSNAKVFIDNNEVDTGNIRGNKIILNGEFREEENCIFDVTFFDNSKCKIKINMKIESEEERKLGNEGNKISTNGKWYSVIQFQ